MLAGAGYLGYLVVKHKPGEGPRAEAGRRAAAPVITAIERYRNLHGEYPDDLDVLESEVPGSVPREINGHPVRYERSGTVYRLTFSYAAPLPTHCTWTPATKWKCGYLTKG